MDDKIADQQFEVLLPEGLDHKRGESVYGCTLLDEAIDDVLGSEGDPFFDSLFLGKDGKLYKIATEVVFEELTDEDEERLTSRGYCLHSQEETCSNCQEEMIMAATVPPNATWNDVREERKACECATPGSCPLCGAREIKT